MPYIISSINLIVDDIVYPVGNVYNREVQEDFFGLRLKDLIDIGGLGIMKVKTISILFDIEKERQFSGQQFRKYNIRCEVTDK
jgi:hypothetical protein